MRRLYLVLPAAALFAACAPAPPPAPQPRPDLTKEAWYPETVEQLAALNRQAESLVRGGRSGEAAGLVSKGEPLVSRLLAASRPTLAAVEAVSDHDDLYGRMLLANRHYGWARLCFQKNVTRWRYWKPETPDTARRLKQAMAAIAECDRRLAE